LTTLINEYYIIYYISTKKPNRTGGFFQNRTETEPNLKNPFRTSLIPTHIHACHHLRLSTIRHANEYTGLISRVGEQLLQNKFPDTTVSR